MPETLRCLRALSLRADPAGLPASLDEKTRSVAVIAASEDPATVMDWESWQPVRESLVMSGCQLPESGRVVLLDSHSRESVGNVLGSFRDLAIESGPQGARLVGRIYFASTPEAEAAFRKVAEGHLTDVSVGYEVTDTRQIKAGESVELSGRTLEGPLRLACQWRLFELSLCPIGADRNALVRKAALDSKEGKETIKLEERKMGEKSERTTLKERLLRLLRALPDDEQPEEEEREEDQPQEEPALVNAEGAEVAPEDMSDEQLYKAIAEVTDVLEDLEAEEAARSESRAMPASEREKGARAERQRIQAIRNMASAHALPKTMEEEMIKSGASLAQVQADVAALVERRQAEGPGFRVSTGLDEKTKFRSAALDSLLLRCGVNHFGADYKAREDKPAPGAEELRGLSLRELAREMLARSGGDARGDMLQIVGRALTTTDLPHLLVETSRRVLMEAYDAAPETWRDWASVGTATDFKKTAAIGIEGDVKPVKLPEYGELEEGRLAENAEEFQIETFARKLTISRQAIINDDLNALQSVPRLYGEQTAELVGDVAYRALLDATLKMGDGKPLFHADHHNVFSGKGGAPTVANLGAVVTGMKLQKDSFGRTITILPKIFLAPVALEVAAEAFFNTQINGGPVQGTQAMPLVANPYGGNYFRRIYDRRLDESAASTWYLLAPRNTVTVYFLGGVEAPYIESRTNFDTDGFESKVRMDVGAKALRWVTCAKASA